MWQKVQGKYHQLLAFGKRTDELARIEDGRVLQTLCQKQVTVQKRNQVSYPFRDDRCGVCDGVSNLIHTSVEEARRYSLPKETRLVVLYRAHELTTSKTLKKEIDQRTGYSRSTRNTYIQRMSAKELIRVTTPGRIKASDHLYEERR